MTRRDLLQKSLAGASGLSAVVSAQVPSAERREQVAGNERNRSRLFPLNLPSGDWIQFRAAGYREPACGVIHRSADKVAHGMPLGGVATGFLDIETNGTFGLASLFNSGVPLATGPWRAPFLGVGAGGRTWVLTLDEIVGVNHAQEIHYWDHYPIADLEYETTALVKNCIRGIVRWGYTWSQPNIVNGATGKRVYGSDYYQNLMLWAVPAAVKGHDIAKASAPGRAGRPSDHGRQ